MGAASKLLSFVFRLFVSKVILIDTRAAAESSRREDFLPPSPDFVSVKADILSPHSFVALFLPERTFLLCRAFPDDR